MLEVVIALVFVMLVLSLFASTVMEAISSILSLRGKNLEKAVRNMLDDTEIESLFFERFKNNPIYQQLSNRFSRKRRAPSYMSDETFRTILFQELLQGKDLEQIKQQIEGLPESSLRKVLLQLMNDAEDDIETFKNKVKNWYNTVMDRASGWYRRQTGQMLVYVGLAIAVIFNADAIGIFGTLQNDPEALREVVDMATDFAQTTDSLNIDLHTQREVRESIAKVQYVIDNQVQNVSTPLGLGWDPMRIMNMSVEEWLFKIVGLIITALAISLGAPFWFDLLKKLVNIRGTGKKPDETSTT